MSGRLEVRILGCGSSGGVPRLGGQWGDCDPDEPRNRRSRCSILVSKFGENGVTRVLIDTSPDLRQQLLDADIGELDAVLYTHSHADHMHGIDDLRMVVFNIRKRLPVWADADTCNTLIDRFGYAFVTPEGSAYPPICDLHSIDGPVTVKGAGGTISFTPFPVQHGSIEALGFRFEGVAYLPDVSDIPASSWHALKGLKCWIVDALRRKPHPTHAHLDKTLEWIRKVHPKTSVLTNMHNDLDYATLLGELPEGVRPAHDGLVLDFPL